MGAQQNRLIGSSEHQKHMFKLIDEKIFAILCLKRFLFCLILGGGLAVSMDI